MNYYCFVPDIFIVNPADNGLGYQIAYEKVDDLLIIIHIQNGNT